MDYKNMYLTLFDATARAIDLLINAHQKVEGLALSQEEPSLHVLNPKEDKDD